MRISREKVAVSKHRIRITQKSDEKLNDAFNINNKFLKERISNVKDGKETGKKLQIESGSLSIDANISEAREIFCLPS